MDVLKPCKAAAREITGETDYEKIAVKLLSLGPKVVAVTMGSEGALIASAGEMAYVPAFKVNVVDSTGAGDAFMGGLSYGILQNWKHRAVGFFANACAAISMVSSAMITVNSRVGVTMNLPSSNI